MEQNNVLLLNDESNKKECQKYLPIAVAGASAIALTQQPSQASGSDPLAAVTTHITALTTAVGGIGALVAIMALVAFAVKLKAAAKKG